MSAVLNLEVAVEEFRRRLLENHGKQIDNGALRAGSPMYYYCQGCEILVATKSEGWVYDPPPMHCKACAHLADHGMLDRLRRETIPPKKAK